MLLVLLDRVQVTCLASSHTLPRRRSCVPEMIRAPAVRRAPTTFHSAVGLHPRALEHEEGWVASAPTTDLGLPVLRAEVRSHVHPERDVEAQRQLRGGHELVAATF